MTLTVLEPPVSAAVFAAEARSFLRLGGTVEDSLIECLIEAAQARLETALSMVMVRQKLRNHFGYRDRAHLASGINVSPRPVTAIHTIRLMNDAGGSDDITDLFQLGDHGVICLKMGRVDRPFPDQGRLECDFSAGFGPDPSDVPADLKLAINRLVADAYFDRNETSSSAVSAGFPTDVAHIVSTYRALRL